MARDRTHVVAITLAAMWLITLAVWVRPILAQDVLIGGMRFTGATGSRTYTIPDADSTFAVSVTDGAWKMAAGSITLDGTNPSSATTGLAAIVACSVIDKRSTAPGDEVSVFTTITDAVAGRLDVYAWVHAAADPTLAASTDSNDVVDYICVGS